MCRVIMSATAAVVAVGVTVLVATSVSAMIVVRAVIVG